MHLGSLAMARAAGAALLFVALVLPAWANVPLASREADRQAKSAVPRAGEAFIYVYWPSQAGAAPLAVTLNGRDTARLTPGTFAMWRVPPGRAVLGAEGTTSTLALRIEGGRVYYVELSRSAAGVSALRQVPFPTGRTQVQRARLVARTPAARPAPSPAKPAAAPVRQPGNFALSLMLGSFELAEDGIQTLNLSTGSFPLQFDASSSSVFSLEGEYFVRPDFSLGVEILKYSNDYTRAPNPSVAGSADTTAVTFNAKRYFAPASSWQPYLGIGAGGATVDLSSNGGAGIAGSTGGVALQLVAGVQWRRDHLALRAEYKYLSADTEDDSNQKVDVSGSGFFLGAGVFF